MKNITLLKFLVVIKEMPKEPSLIIVNLYIKRKLNLVIVIHQHMVVNIKLILKMKFLNGRNNIND